MLRMRRLSAGLLRPRRLPIMNNLSSMSSNTKAKEETNHEHEEEEEIVCIDRRGEFYYEQDRVLVREQEQTGDLLYL